MRDNPAYLLPICVYAASEALAAQLERARKGVDLALKYKPGLRISNLRELAAFRRDQDFAHIRLSSHDQLNIGVARDNIKEWPCRAWF